MSRPEPRPVFYLNQECTDKIDPSTISLRELGPCEAGESEIYDVYARNESDIPYESYEIKVEACYQKPAEKQGDITTSIPTKDLELLSTPRPHRLKKNEVVHIRLKWSPPLNNWYPIIVSIRLEGHFLIHAVG